MESSYSFYNLQCNWLYGYCLSRKCTRCICHLEHLLSVCVTIVIIFVRIALLSFVTENPLSWNKRQQYRFHSSSKKKWKQRRKWLQSNNKEQITKAVGYCFFYFFFSLSLSIALISVLYCITFTFRPKTLHANNIEINFKIIVSHVCLHTYWPKYHLI